MIKKPALALLVSLFGMSALADGWELDAGYEYFLIDSPDVGISALGATAGYRWDFGTVMSGRLEVNAAVGIADDSTGSLTVDVDSAFGAAFRLSRQLNDDWSIYGRFSYTDVTLGVSSAFLNGDFETADDGLGLGVGATYRGFTFGYTNYLGDLSTLNLGYRWTF